MYSCGSFVESDGARNRDETAAWVDPANLEDCSSRPGGGSCGGAPAIEVRRGEGQVWASPLTCARAFVRVAVRNAAHSHARSRACARSRIAV